MSLPELLSQYGYFAVFIGSILEGETILVLAGFAAHQGYLSFPVVVLLALLGGTLGDQIYFFLGRFYGGNILARFPQLASRTGSVRQLIERYHTSLIVGVRFMYGFRIIGPLVIGMSEVCAWRFILLNLCGATAWSILIGGAGYLFGQTLQLLTINIKRYEGIALVVMVILVFIFHLIRRLRSKYRTN